MPSSAEEWLNIEEGFRDNFPHAVGAIDGKHVVMISPAGSGSDYYNYKKTFSIVLLALVNSKYQFMFADIGSQGRISDGGVLQNSVLWKKICDGELNLPEPSPLPGSRVGVPYVFLGDGAFALSTHVMKPFPGEHEYGSLKRNFNDRLSRSRVIVENSFGILSSRFRVFRKPIALQPEKVTLITMACISLHNFLINSNASRQVYNPPGTMDTYDDNGLLIQQGTWRQEVNEQCAIRPVAGVPRRSTNDASKIRQQFATYFDNL
jgi:hypothetical protein